jgi:hypothetical protein
VTPEAELVQAASGLARALRESLHAPPHSSTVAPLREKLRKLWRRRFARQRILFLRHARPWLKHMAAQYSEADATPDDLRRKLQATVAQQIAAGAVLDSGVTHEDSAAYDAIVEIAAQGAIETLAVQTGIDAAKNAGNRFAMTYLRDSGFKKLAADVDETTKTRIADAVADTYAEGGSYGDAVRAIKGAFSEATDFRAETIAQTEIADAYNQAILSSAKEIPGPGVMKEWATDGEACEEICVPNEDQGPIPIDAWFDSGDEAPPGHPRCNCSLSIVLP